MKLSQSVPLNLIHDIAHHNELSTWVKIHAIYPESKVYYFDYNKLARVTGLSHTTLRKHIKEMLRLRWCYMRDGHLCFVGLNKLGVVYQKNGLAKDSPLIPLQVHEKKSDQILEFRHAIIKGNLNNQVKKIKRKTEILKKCQTVKSKLSPKELRAISKAGGVTQFARSITNYSTLSNLSFGKLTGRSKSTGRRIQKTLRDKFYLKVRYNFDVVKNNVAPLEFRFFRMDNPQPFYIYDVKERVILKQRSNSVESIKGIVGAQKL